MDCDKVFTAEVIWCNGLADEVLESRRDGPAFEARFEAQPVSQA